MMANRIGQRFGDYRLIRFLGAGTFGEVYLSEHVYHKTQVAVKVLKMQLTPDRLKDFIKEARAFRLKHPNIVQLFDFGIENDIPFLVMDYAPNGSLRQRHPRGTRLPLATIVTYVKQIAAALQYAHDQRLIHRDVKPENLLLGPQGEVLLSDFNTSIVAHRTITESTQEIAGTALYMAPEQFRGKPRAACDQYALGVIVYEWLCGEPPFNGHDFIQLGYQHTYDSPPLLRSKVPSLSAAVEQVVMTALAKEPQQRFASIQDFAQALEQASQVQQNLAPVSPPVPAPHPEVGAKVLFTRSPKWKITKGGSRDLLRSTAMLFIGIAILLAVGSVALLSLPKHPGKTLIPTSTATSHPRPSPSSTATLHPTASPDLTPTATPILRDNSNIAMFGFDLQHTHFNPGENTLNLVNVARLVLYWKAVTKGSIGSSPVVANGMVYVGSYDRTLYAFDAKTGTNRWYDITGNVITSSPAVANSVVYIGSYDHTLYAIDSRTGTILWSTLIGYRIQSSPAIANGVVYIGADDQNLYAIDTKTGAKLWTYPTQGPITSSPAVDSNTVYVGSYDHRLYAIDAKTGAKLWTYTTGGVINSSPAVSNGVIYIGSDDKNLYAIDTKTGAKLWSYATQGAISSSPAIANDAVYVGSHDSNLYALEAKTGVLLWTYTTRGAISSSPAVANGVVYVGSADFNLYAFDATNGAKLWAYATKGAIYSPPTVINGVVYVGSDDDNLYAFHLPS